MGKPPLNLFDRIASPVRRGGRLAQLKPFDPTRPLFRSREQRRLTSFRTFLMFLFLVWLVTWVVCVSINITVGLWNWLFYPPDFPR